MFNTLKYAQYIYYEKKREWNKMVDRAMAADFSWASSAKQYEEMYNWMLDAEQKGCKRLENDLKNQIKKSFFETK